MGEHKLKAVKPIGCDREGCTTPAKGMLQLEVFPHKAVMELYKTNQPLSRLIINLALCQQHCDEIVPSTFFALNDWQKMVKFIEARNSGIVVDIEGSKFTLVPFNNHEVKLLLKQRKEKEDGQA